MRVENATAKYGREVKHRIELPGRCQSLLFLSASVVKTSLNKSLIFVSPLFATGHNCRLSDSPHRLLLLHHRLQGRIERGKDGEEVMRTKQFTVNKLELGNKATYLRHMRATIYHHCNAGLDAADLFLR
jgi:hypothetical protein